MKEVKSFIQDQFKEKVAQLGDAVRRRDNLNTQIDQLKEEIRGLEELNAVAELKERQKAQEEVLNSMSKTPVGSNEA